jgi:hypothetical protein
MTRCDSRGACRDLNLPTPPGNALAYPAYMAKQSTSSKDKYTDPKLREEVKRGVKKSGKGGRPGQWTARKGARRVKRSY